MRSTSCGEQVQSTPSFAEGIWTCSKMRAMLFCAVVLLAAFCAASAEDIETLMEQFIAASPRHPQVRTPDVWAPDTAQSKFTHNEPYTGAFQPLDECSENRTTLLLGDFGTVTTPNYPRNYPARLACEWILESPPATKIQVVFFDLFTQPWFFAYFDYVMVAKNGDFSTVDRMSGDMNGKTPMIIMSESNKFGIRFRSSALFNFRGFKLQYLVVPEDENVALIEPPVFDGICGQSTYVPSATTPSPTPTVTVPVPAEPIVTNPVPVESEPQFPIIKPDPTVPEATKDGRKKPPTGGIVGGNDVLKYSYPWMAALLIDGKHFCGGSLISNQYVLTAAHCTDKANAVTILLGTHNIKANKTIEDGRRIFNITRSNIFQHPEYNENTITHDISILKLPEPILFTDRIRPVCIPNRYSIARFFTDEDVKVSGWGKNSDRAPGVNPTLKEAQVKVISNEVCRNTFRGIVTGNLICVATKREASPCKGDSGGPLMAKRNGPGGSYMMQVGIVSFGSLTCEGGQPVGFTRVSAFLDYVNTITGSNY